MVERVLAKGSGPVLDNLQMEEDFLSVGNMRMVDSFQLYAENCLTMDTFLALDSNCLVDSLQVDKLLMDSSHLDNKLVVHC